MKCSNIFFVFIVLTLSKFSYSYTITKDVIPPLPTETLDDTYLVRHLPDGEVVNITCPDDTVLNRETLTCDFKNNLKKNILFAIPSDDCRRFKLCDGKRCTEMICPADTLFNVQTGNCDYPERANCCEFDAKNASRILHN